MANGKSLKDFRQERDMDSVYLFCFVLIVMVAVLGIDCNGPERREMGRMLFQVKEDAILGL